MFSWIEEGSFPEHLATYLIPNDGFFMTRKKRKWLLDGHWYAKDGNKLLGLLIIL